MKNLQINPRLFALLALSFVLATIVGTLSHELGHFAAIKYYGGNPVLHYASVSNQGQNDISSDLKKRYQKDRDKIESPSPSPEKEAFMAYREGLGKKLEHSLAYIWLAGPLQTMLTGTLGVAMLWIRRKKIATFGMCAADWFWVLLAFFWSRQLANFGISIIQYIQHCTCLGNGDEAKISRYLGWPPLTVYTITGVIAAVLQAVVVFVIIPKTQRFNFILAGFVGSALGWLVWMEWMGPVLLP